MLERRNRRAPRNLSSHREGACGRASSEAWRLTATTDSGGVPRSDWEGSPPERPRALAARGTDGRARGASAPRARLSQTPRNRRGSAIPSIADVDEESLSVAAVGRPIIKRPRLTRLLDEAQTRVTMLVAPAG